jgi:hypothetical protein
MTELTLTRDTDDGVTALGVLDCKGSRWQTVERPWVPDLVGKGGKPGVSCVAAGIYKLERHSTEKHPNCWALVNPMLDVYHLPDDCPRDRRSFSRAAILIHPANFSYELEGCIAPNKSRGKDGATGRLRGFDSRAAFNELRQLIDRDFELTLIIVYQGENRA